MWFYIGSTLVVSVLGVMCNHVSLSLCKLSFFLVVPFLKVRFIFNVTTWLTLLVIDLFLYLCVLGLSTLVPVFFFTSGISFECASGASSLIVPISIIDIFPVSGCYIS